MKLVDCLKQTITATNLATMTMGGAVTGFRTVSQAIADGDLAVGDTDLPMMVRIGAVWEFSLFTVTSATVLTRQSVLGSSAGGAAVTFPAGNKEAFCDVPAEYLAGKKPSDLPTLSLMTGDLVLAYRPSTGVLGLLLASSFGTGGTTAPADTTGPAFPDALSSSSVTQTAFRLSWQAATDANGIQKYEYSFDGSTWVSAGTALFVDITGRTAGASYTMRARAVDPAGNPSTVRTLVVVMQAASGGTNSPPTMSGSLSITNQSSSGYTIGWPAATDPDGNLAGYDYSIDGGTTFTQLGNVLTVNVSGRPASNTDQVRVRARDVPGLTSNVLSASATTTAAVEQTPFSVTGYGSPANSIKTTYDVNSAYTNVYDSMRQVDMSRLGTNASYPGYFNLSRVPPSLKVGWGTSPTVPPGDTPASFRNGLSTVTPAATIGLDTILWAANGSGDGVAPAGDGTKFYLWFVPSDGPPFCFNPSGLALTNA